MLDLLYEVCITKIELPLHSQYKESKLVGNRNIFGKISKKILTLS